ncbi:hypothetical protein [Brachybacterium sp. YJGR34]|uniref:hypothetical protein n=1 Tax=Brachybacterium sp. YJGR34 TaxID=2059911 RepID=UPI000E0C620F|nr:hypothetical protein [Brachybacterium sp. YJGR34]
MSWVGVVLGIIVAVVLVLVAGAALAYGSMRRRYRRQLDRQAQQAAEFPAWADEHGYAFSADFPESDVDRLRGLGHLMPFSDFVFSRVEHVFRRTEHGRVRYLLQLTVLGEPGPAVRPRGALTVAVAELPSSSATAAATHAPAASRGQASVHAHGRWVTSYLGGPLTISSMETVEEELDRYLQTR